MRIAILTDIHANREAFQAVLEDAASRAIDRFVLLGDIVGYGPDPGWCVDRVAEMLGQGAVAVLGNHDEAVARGTPEGMSALARVAVQWTMGQLDAGQKALLAGLPLRHAEADVLFVHASANDPGDWMYVTSAERAMPSFRVTTARLIFCGHVHVPALMSCDVGGVVTRVEVPIGRPISLIRSRRWMGVIGAVGQPRDGVPLASYAVLDLGANELTFRRVPYDVARTVQKLRTAGLPEQLAQRLTRGE